MEISFSARSRGDHDILDRIIKSSQANNSIYEAAIDDHALNINTLWNIVKAQAEMIDNLNSKIDYLESNMKYAIGSALPPKHQAMFMQKANRAEREAKECYERISNEIAQDYGNRIKKLQK